MFAMTVRAANGSAILLGKDFNYPAPSAFYVAHELAHILLGHLEPQAVMVDLGDSESIEVATDPEEVAADAFALELLTGSPDPRVLPFGHKPTARRLARAALEASRGVKIEPGTLALCFGYSTKNWKVANGALNFIYSAPIPVWGEVNKFARTQLLFDRLSDDTQSYLEAVLGETAR